MRVSLRLARQRALPSAGHRGLSSAAAAAPPLDTTAHPSVILLGGLGMKPRALEKTAAALYPSLSVQQYTHSLNELVNVSFRFPSVQQRFAAALADAGPGGAIVHVFSGAAFFSLLALRDWSAAAAAAGGQHPLASRIRGVVLDSIPYKRVESKLMAAVRVPSVLVPAATALASRLLVSPLFGATVALTDEYQAAQRAAATFACTGGRRVLVAHSAEDAIVSVGEFHSYVGSLRSAPGWRPASQPGAASQPAGRGADGAVHHRDVHFDVFEGRGRHAAMVLDDEAYTHAVRKWVTTLYEP